MSQDNAIQKIQPRELTAETSKFADYLTQIGLPTDNVIASTDERDVIAANLPVFLSTLSNEERRDARYLSKFVGATAIGLFDAALNYVWNEVILNLRRKACVYGIELFFDAAVGGSNRDFYKDERDLEGLKDSVLLDTCRKLELVSDIVYRKVDHILTMRNEVAASHPNVESIGGFELLGWLQTCVKDVLKDQPSESAIRIKSLVNNIRSATAVIDAGTVDRFNGELRNLSLPHVHNLLITLFGMYVGDAADQVLRKNISLLAQGIWRHAEERVKYRIGTMVDGYRTNLERDKLDRSIEFLAVVDGRAFESLPARLVALGNLANKLRDAHNGWDNFHHEPAVMREILAYCKRSTDIPEEIRPLLTRAILACRIGRGLSYREGVSPVGRTMYDQFLEMLDDDGIATAIQSLYLPELNSKLVNATCQKHLVSILQIFKRIAISDRLKEAIDQLAAAPADAWRANANRKFSELMAPFAQKK